MLGAPEFVEGFLDLLSCILWLQSCDLFHYLISLGGFCPLLVPLGDVNQGCAQLQLSGAHGAELLLGPFDAARVRGKEYVPAARNGFGLRAWKNAKSVWWSFHDANSLQEVSVVEVSLQIARERSNMIQLKIVTDWNGKELLQ